MISEAQSIACVPMKRVAAISVALTSVLLSAGQNLVPNGSFEEYTSCPELISSVFLTGWTNLHTTSADYFNACNLNGVADVPLNQFGYQYASDGQAYVGLATTGGGGFHGIARSLVWNSLNRCNLASRSACLFERLWAAGVAFRGIPRSTQARVWA